MFFLIKKIKQTFNKNHNYINKVLTVLENKILKKQKKSRGKEFI